VAFASRLYTSRPRNRCLLQELSPTLGCLIIIHLKGGAERLVVDAALGLKARGHSVDIYTSHHDPSHCFEETKDGM
jgi:hypothetical protein